MDKHSLQSHFCDPGSIPVLAVSCGLSSFLLLALLREFFSGISGFPPSTKTNTSQSQFDLDELPRVCQCPHCYAFTLGNDLSANHFRVMVASSI